MRNDGRLMSHCLVRRVLKCVVESHLLPNNRLSYFTTTGFIQSHEHVFTILSYVLFSSPSEWNLNGPPALCLWWAVGVSAVKAGGSYVTSGDCNTLH